MQHNDVVVTPLPQSVIMVRERKRFRRGQTWTEWQVVSHRTVVSRQQSDTIANRVADALRADWQRMLIQP